MLCSVVKYEGSGLSTKEVKTKIRILCEHETIYSILVLVVLDI